MPCSWCTAPVLHTGRWRACREGGAPLWGAQGRGLHSQGLAHVRGGHLLPFMFAGQPVGGFWHGRALLAPTHSGRHSCVIGWCCMSVPAELGRLRLGGSVWGPLELPHTPASTQACSISTWGLCTCITTGVGCAVHRFQVRNSPKHGVGEFEDGCTTSLALDLATPPCELDFGTRLPWLALPSLPQAPWGTGRPRES